MTLRRLLWNLLVAVALAVILIGLVIIHIDERASKHVSASDPARWTQEIPFEEVKI